MTVRRVLSIAAAVALAAAVCRIDLGPPPDGESTAAPPAGPRIDRGAPPPAPRSKPSPTTAAAQCDGVRADSDPRDETFAPRTSDDDRGTPDPPSVSGRLVDAAGYPAPYLELRLWNRTSSRNTYSRANGSFEATVDAVRAGYDVDAFVRDDLADISSKRRVHVGTIRPGDHNVVLRMPLAPTVLAEGVLVDESAAALCGWHVLANTVRDDERFSRCVASDETDADGRFRIMSWTPADIALIVEDVEHARRRIESQTVDPATGVVRIVVNSPDIIAGRVVAEHGGDVRGAVVRLRRVDDDVELTTVVDASGDFVFKRLDAKSFYRLRVECAGYVEEPREGDCSVGHFDVRLHLAKAQGVIAGRLLDAASSPASSAWLRFVALDGGLGFQLMTEEDGSFKTYEARDVEYDVHVLAPAGDGRLVSGASIGRCRGGATALLFRAPR